MKTSIKDENDSIDQIKPYFLRNIDKKVKIVQNAPQFLRNFPHRTLIPNRTLIRYTRVRHLILMSPWVT